MTDEENTLLHVCEEYDAIARLIMHQALIAEANGLHELRASIERQFWFAAHVNRYAYQVMASWNEQFPYCQSENEQ